MTNVIYDNLDKSRPLIDTFIDLAKAFDTVNHNILLEKLYSYSISGTACDLLKTYFTNKCQIIIINASYSGYEAMPAGEPQGTTFGPMLFVISINDLLSVLPDKAMVSYADDI